MKHLSAIVLLFIAVELIFAQSNYEVMFNRPDITGLTGGGATNLDGIPTTGLAVGTIVIIYDGSESRIYRLTVWTAEVETPPTIIIPDDWANPGNAKVWKASISSDPGETGHSGGGTTYSIGDFAQGGIVFWVDETGQHGLVCAKSDQYGGSGVRWYAGTYGNTRAIGDGPYAGEANTSIIIAAQVAIGDDGFTYAARICNELQITEGGKTYGDWYLPSKEELNLMYQNKATIDATATANSGSGFASAYYWSSSEENSNYAWNQTFYNGSQDIDYKFYSDRVRAVRAF